MGNITTVSREGKLNHTFQGWDTSPHFAGMGNITSLCRDDAHHCVLQEWDTTPDFPWIGYITQLSIDGTYHPSIQGWDILPTFQGWYISPQFPGIGHKGPSLSMNRTDFPSFSKIRYITYLCRDEIHFPGMVHNIPLSRDRIYCNKYRSKPHIYKPQYL